MNKDEVKQCNCSRPFEKRPELVCDPKAIHEELKRDRERRTTRVRKHLLP